MSTGIWAAVSGAVAQTSALDVAANNIANSSTPGFRADRELFRETLANAQRGADGSLRYSVVRNVRPDLNAGQITTTNRGLDVALRGADGFFAVKTPQGERYTRAGHMSVSSDGTLTTADGHAYLGANRQPIRVPPDSKEVTFGPDGSLLVDGMESGSSSVSSSSRTLPDSKRKATSCCARGPRPAGRSRWMPISRSARSSSRIPRPSTA